MESAVKVCSPVDVFPCRDGPKPAFSKTKVRVSKEQEHADFLMQPAVLFCLFTALRSGFTHQTWTLLLHSPTVATQGNVQKREFEKLISTLTQVYNVKDE